MALNTGSAVRLFGLATALWLLTACQPNAETGAAADDPWQQVQAYIDADGEWHRRGGEISRSEDAPDEKSRQREELGSHPEITAAVAAARSLVATPGHARVAAAAEFLMEHPYGLSETAREDMALGAQVLADQIGADWSVIQDYKDRLEARRQREGAFSGGVRGATPRTQEEIAAAEVSDEERETQREALGERPKGLRATAAALAILDAEAHADTVAAAEFLVIDAPRPPGSAQYAYRGAKALAANAADYDDWPSALMNLDRRRFDADEQIDAFIEEMADRAGDPVVQATARYYLAVGLAQSASDPAASAEDRRATRERALAVAEGLSGGLADVAFVGSLARGDSESAQGTLAQAEAELLHRIKHTTVGGTLPNAVGAKLDGTEESLSAYAGKVVLVDFWATWCVPCIAALPKLRELVAEHPSDRFALLSISVDDELETVTDFQAGEPMPWPNWHVGVDSDIVREWDVRGFPTYVVADEQGVILARTHQLDGLLPVIAEAIGV